MKARSRLKNHPPDKAVSRLTPKPVHTPIRQPRSSGLGRRISTNKLPIQLPQFDIPQISFNTSAYSEHLGTLFISLGLFFLVVSLMRTVPPASIANWLMPNTYFPFLLLFGSASFFLASFMWLNTRRGAITTLIVLSLLFLKLQKIMINWQVVLGVVSLFVIIELVFTYLESHSHASFHQNPHSRRRRART